MKEKELTNEVFRNRKQDYSQELFNLSRVEQGFEESKNEGFYHTMVGREWCGDLARYIVDLERVLLFKDLDKTTEGN